MQSLALIKGLIFFNVNYVGWLRTKTGTQNLVYCWLEVFMRLWGWIWRFNRLLSCSAVDMEEWHPEKRKIIKTCCLLLETNGKHHKMLKPTENWIAWDQRSRIKRGEQSLKMWTRNNEVLNDSPTDVGSCVAEGRWVQQKIKHKENVFVCEHIWVCSGWRGWMRGMKREKHSQNIGRGNTNQEEGFNWLPGENRFRHWN